jgi:hypothetical protein
VLGDSQFVNASERCYDLMSSWGCYDILYLSPNLSITPRANLITNRANLSWALTNWLKSNSNPDAQVWIWIFSHGVGLHHHSLLYYGDTEGWYLDDPYYGGWGRAEMISDEGNEITEYLVDKDVDGDGTKSNTTWFGVDEGIGLKDEEIAWDDEFKDWLGGVVYRRMMIFLSTCRSPEPSENETESCFSGGFIDDLSAPRRIIISCTNETYYG